MVNQRKFIKKAITRKGALRSQLKIPMGKNIPMTLLDRIIAAKVGDTIKNPTRVGVRRIKITRKLEQRSVLARNLRSFKRRR